MITSFDGEFRFLSNFYPSAVFFEGMCFKTVEHAYQAAKTLDVVERRKIAKLPTPGAAKRYKKTLQREGWSLVNLHIMEFLVRQKFQDKELSKLLVETYPEELIEGNTWGDVFWGAVWNGVNWFGKNHLGKILMKIRQEHLWLL